MGWGIMVEERYLIFFLQDYTLSTGDKVIRFSCVAINMARTDGILSTGVAIDSAIVGMTAMVYVNGSAFVCFFSFFIIIFIVLFLFFVLTFFSIFF